MRDGHGVSRPQDAYDHIPRQTALVRGSANVRNLVFDGPAYLVAPVEAWQRTDFGRPQASIRLRMATPIAASVC